MGNVLHATSLGVSMVDMKFTSSKIMQFKNLQHVSSVKKNIVSGSCLLKDGFKLVIESTKFALSKYEIFVGKGYECRDMFSFSLEDFSGNIVNHVCTSIYETNLP
jgi:hypothetical protein